jgi:hypothetical protein
MSASGGHVLGWTIAISLIVAGLFGIARSLRKRPSGDEPHEPE